MTLAMHVYNCDQCLEEALINPSEEEVYPLNWWSVTFENMSNAVDEELDFCGDECLIKWLKERTNSSQFKI